MTDSTFALGEQRTPVRSHAAVIFNPLNINIVALREAFTREEKVAGLEPTVFLPTTAAQDSAFVATQEALAGNPCVIVAVGGDGTIRCIAEALEGHQLAEGHHIPVGIVPTGTGNLLARTLHVPLMDMKRAVHVALSGVDRPIDTVVAELGGEGNTRRHIFLVMAGIGLDADMAAETDGRLKKCIGWLAYVAPIAQSVGRNRHHEAVVTIDDSEKQAISAHTMIVGNCGSLPGNLLLLPEARIDDGLLDAVVLRPKGPGGWARIWSRLAVGGVLHRVKGGSKILRAAPTFQALRYAQATTLTLTLDSPQRIELDGDSFGQVSSLRVSVVHHGLTVRVPAESVF
ncbi:MAG: diacylglycerol kinase family enzyme [Alpinimonas sp.]|jgi:diacylglycerol kinase family enzyme